MDTELSPLLRQDYGTQCQAKSETQTRFLISTHPISLLPLVRTFSTVNALRLSKCTIRTAIISPYKPKASDIQTSRLSYTLGNYHSKVKKAIHQTLNITEKCGVVSVISQSVLNP